VIIGGRLALSARLADRPAGARKASRLMDTQRKFLWTPLSSWSSASAIAASSTRRILRRAAAGLRPGMAVAQA
jgi:hypothetical protein